MKHTTEYSDNLKMFTCFQLDGTFTCISKFLNTGILTFEFVPLVLLLLATGHYCLPVWFQKIICLLFKCFKLSLTQRKFILVSILIAAGIVFYIISTQTTIAVS